VKQAISYCGLCGDEKSSADKAIRTPLSKRGSWRFGRAINGWWGRALARWPVGFSLACIRGFRWVNELRIYKKEVLQLRIW